jgi:hypothetical protein
MTFDAVGQIADAVLYEGYVLYPYRASSMKNQFRWQFGVLAPRAPHDEGEPSFSQTECLIEPAGTTPRLAIRVRFLRATPLPRDDGSSSRPWLEGVPHAIDLDTIDLSDRVAERVLPLPDAGIRLQLTVRTDFADRFVKVHLRLENLEPWHEGFTADRDAMLERALVGTHLLLGVDGGSFVSLLEPPDDAVKLVAGCRNQHVWPVLVGDRSRRDTMLSSPIVLYDYPAVAKESQGDLCDAAEIDEILSLRIMTMTDEERRQARATDPRARAILDRIEALTPETLATLHGAIRSADFFNPRGMPPPDEAFVMVGGCRIAKGSRVRLRPNRRADAMDIFLDEQPATVAGVFRDVDERMYVAVTIDADPAASLHESIGRFFYFDPAEIEPLDGAG